MKKGKIIKIILIIFLLLNPLFSNTINRGFFNGDAFAFEGGGGTESNPYLISDWNDLNNIRNELNASYKLVNDLTSTTNGYTDNASSSANSSAGWLPLGDSSNPFLGSLNGNGYLVEDLFIDRGVQRVGLFSTMGTDSLIENIGLKNVNISGAAYTGAIVGYMDGGLIKNSYTTGSVTGADSTGGIAGLSNGSVENCYNQADVTGSSNWGSDRVGGVVGRGSNVSYSYNTGYLIDQADSNPAGVATNAFNSYWDSETSGQAVNGGTPKTTSEMMSIDTFSGWDIETSTNYNNNTWYINEGSDYPRLGWELMAEVKSNKANNLEAYQADLNGELTDLSGESSVDVYFEWGEQGSGMPNTTTIQSKSSTGTFSSTVSGLSSGTTYEFRAVVSNSLGNSYGDTKTFTTEFVESWLSDWKKRREITIDGTNIDSDLTHFPVPIKIGDSTGKNNSDLTNIFDEVGSNYKKIAITKADGQTQLYVEVEKWDSANEKALLWVSKNDLVIDNEGDTFYFYYDDSKSDNSTFIGSNGNRSEVWDANYRAVWHLSEDASGLTDEFKDSTGNNYHGTGGGGNSMQTPARVDASIGYGQDFNNTNNQYIDLSTYQFGLDGSSQATLEAWHNSDTETGYIYSRGEYVRPFRLHWDGSFETTLRLSTDGTVYQSFSSPTLNQWAYTAQVYNQELPSLNYKLFQDGVLDSSMDAAGTFDASSGSNAYIGAHAGGPQLFYDGQIAEVRFSDSQRSDAWIKASHYGYEDNLLTWSKEEENVPTAITNEASEISDQQADLNGELTDLSGESSVDVYFEWGEQGSGMPNTTSIKSKSIIGSFSETISGLKSGNTYEFRAVAENSIGSGYGEIKNFTIFKTEGVITLEFKNNIINIQITEEGLIQLKE